MTNVSTRIATPDDEAGVSALLKASYSVLMVPDYAPDFLAKALPLITRANLALLKSGTYFVVHRQDGDFIGCGGWTPKRPGLGEREPGLGHIRHFATHPNWTRCGVGRALMNKCKDTAHQQGVSRFECYSSLSAQSFYTAMGFETRGPIDIALKDVCVFPSIQMDCVF